MISFLLVALVAAIDEGIDTIIDNSEADRLALKQEQENKELDTIYYTCIVLSRMHLQTYGDQLLSVIKNQNSAEDQSNVWKKLYTAHVISCAEKINYEDSVQILAQVRAEQFDNDRLAALFDVEFELYLGTSWVKEFSETENGLWKYIEEFESVMAEHKLKQKQQSEMLNKALELEELQDLEYIKLAASIQKPKRDIPQVRGQTNAMDILFLIVAFSTIGLIIFLAYRRLSLIDQKIVKKSK